MVIYLMRVQYKSHPHLCFTNAQRLIHTLLAVDNRFNDWQRIREIGEQDMLNPQPRAVCRQVILPIALLFYEKDIGVLRRGNI